MKLLDFIHNTKTQAYLAFTIVIGGFTLVKFGHLSDSSNNRLFDLMFLTATFYFGSSKSGSNKDETIKALAGSQDAATVTSVDTVNVDQTIKP